jgi:hypothetical protein
MLHLGDHPARPIPRRGLVLEAAIADQRGVAGSVAGPDEEVLDGLLQHGIGRETDSICHVPWLQRLVEGREGKGRVGADDDGLSPGPVPVHDGQEHLLPRVGTVNVARPERGREAVTVLVEDEKRMVADGLEVAVVG